MSPQHAQDLLKAFRLDATKLRYRDWDDLMAYCAYSAMPVGRFVLDVHGESRSTWPASDAICAALQIINHLQDCAADYRNLDRVYIPLDALAACGLGVEALGAAKASPELRRCIAGLARAHREHFCMKGDALPSIVAGLAARARALGHPDAGAAPHAHAHATRSLERARTSRQARRRRHQPRGRAQGDFAPRRSSPANLGGAAVSAVTDEPVAEPQQRASGSSFYLAMRIMPKAQREAMFEIYSFCRGSTISPTKRPARPTPRAIAALARRHRRALCRHAAAAPEWAGACRARLRPAARGLPRRHRRHGDGRRSPTSARPTSRPSTFIATASPARSAG